MTASASSARRDRAEQEPGPVLAARAGRVGVADCEHGSLECEHAERRRDRRPRPGPQPRVGRGREAEQRQRHEPAGEMVAWTAFPVPGR